MWKRIQKVILQFSFQIFSPLELLVNRSYNIPQSASFKNRIQDRPATRLTTSLRWSSDHLPNLTDVPFLCPAVITLRNVPNSVSPVVNPIT